MFYLVHELDDREISLSRSQESLSCRFITANIEKPPNDLGHPNGVDQLSLEEPTEPVLIKGGNNTVAEIKPIADGDGRQVV